MDGRFHNEVIFLDDKNLIRVKIGVRMQIFLPKCVYIYKTNLFVAEILGFFKIKWVFVIVPVVFKVYIIGVVEFLKIEFSVRILRYFLQV